MFPTRMKSLRKVKTHYTVGGTEVTNFSFTLFFIRTSNFGAEAERYYFLDELNLKTGGCSQVTRCSVSVVN